MDDIVITDDDAQGISELKLYLNKKFKQKIWDNYDIFLGIEVAKSKKEIFLSQRK